MGAVEGFVSDVAEPLTLLKAALADRYAIERELGRGGMATVFLAQDLKHHRAVAVKLLRAELAGPIGPERFLREIEIAAGLSHPLRLGPGGCEAAVRPAHAG